WVGTYSNGINKANLNGKPFNYHYHDPFNPNSIIDNNVRAICEDKTGNLWIGTRDKGITVIRGDAYRHIRFSEENHNTIGSDQIKRIFCDSRGVIWIGTKKGLDTYNPKTNTFRSFSPLGIVNTTVFGIAEDKSSNLWFASWKGVYRYVRSEDKLIHYDPDKTLQHKHARVVMLDNRGLIWVGTEGGGISVLK